MSVAYDDVDGRLTVVFEDSVYFRAVNSSGDTCLGIEGWISPGESFDGIEWTCGSSTSDSFTYSLDGVDVPMVLRLEPRADGSSVFTLTISEPTLLPPGCHLETTKLTFRQTAGCE